MARTSDTTEALPDEAIAALAARRPPLVTPPVELEGPSAIVHAMVTETPSTLEQLLATSGLSEPDVRAALATLSEVGLLVEHGRGTIAARSLHPLFSAPGGCRPGPTIEVSILPRRRDRDEALLLAAFSGATLDRQDCNASPSVRAWRLVARHDGGTDFEHDSIILFDATVEALEVSAVRWNGTVEMTAVLGELSMWEQGTDPFHDPSWCTYEHCPQPHLMGKYCPPRRRELRALEGSRLLITQRVVPRPAVPYVSDEA